MPLRAPDFERLFAPGVRRTPADGGVTAVRLRRDASLWLPSGWVVAGEPLVFEVMSEDPFVHRVAPGRYPLELVVAVSGEPGAQDADEVVAAARLVIRDAPIASWEMAVREGQDVSLLGEGEFFGYAVDGGTGGFVDSANLAPLHGYDDYFERMLAELDVRETDPTAPATLTDDEGRPLVVAFSAGAGDGYYPTWVGRTADGEVACFTTDFFVLTDGGGGAGDVSAPVDDLTRASRV